MTPQQANLAPCPFCGGPARHLEKNPGFYDERAICDTCNYSVSPAAWNRRAPAPTEPAVDRDAAGDFSAWLVREMPPGTVIGDPAWWARKIAARFATPASPADDDLDSLIYPPKAMLKREDWDAATRKPRAAASSDPRVDDLAMLTRQLVRALSKAAPSHDLPAKALDYLKRKGLQGSPLREAVPEPAPLAPIPDVLFDGMAVYAEITRRLGKGHCHNHQTVSATLDAVVRLIRASQPTSAEGKDSERLEGGAL